jgi:hypothetical protein
MAQHDYVISNGSGATVRADLNDALAAIVSQNSGSTQPATTYAYQLWVDTTTGLYKIRNSANNGWITIGTLASTNLGLATLASPTFTGTITGPTFTASTAINIPIGSAASPTLHFTGDVNTGIFSSGSDAFDIATAGIRRFGINSSGDPTIYGGNVTINAQGDLRLADSDSSHYVALQAPSTVASNVTFTLPNADGSNGQALVTNGSGTLSWAAATGYYNRRPVLHRGPIFSKTAATSISVAAGTVLIGYYYAAATAVTMPGSFTNNTDYAIWQHPSSGALVADSSFTTAPAGAAGGAIVGGFHYIPSGRPTAFNNGSPTSTAEILEYSIWDLTWRPVCPDPRGMANIDGRFWCDLYLCGATSFAGTTFSAVPSSRIGLTIADNSSPALIPSFYGGNGSTVYSLTGNNNPGSLYNFAEVAHSFGKRFMWLWEFQAAAFGAPEASSRGSDPGTVQWERVSKWGLAQATGTLHVWGSERVGINAGGSINTGGRGTELADAPRAVLLGGNWGVGSDSGSRSARWDRAPSNGDSTVGARFAAEHLILG